MSDIPLVVPDDLPHDGPIASKWYTCTGMFHFAHLEIADVARTVGSQAVPIAGSLLLRRLNQVVTIAFVGHALGNQRQATFNIAFSIVQTVIIRIGVGYMNTMDTFVSQAFGRDPSGRQLMVIMLRGVTHTLMVTLSIYVLLAWAMAPLLIQWLGDNGEEAVRLTRLSLPYIPINVIGYGVGRALQAQLLSYPVTLCYVVMIVTSPLICWLVIKDDTSQAITAMNLTGLVLLLGEVLVAMFHPKSKLGYLPPDFNFFSDVLSCHRIIEFGKLGAPSTIINCALWWGWEVFIFQFSALGSTVAVNGVSALTNLLNLVKSATAGLQTAGGIAEGRALGANKPKEAEEWSRFNILSQFCAFALNATALLALQDYIFAAYSPDARVVAALKGALAGMILYMLMDALQTGFVAIYTGAARQPRSSLICTVSVLVFVAVGYVAASRADTDTERLLYVTLAAAGANFLSLPVLMYIVHQWNWDELATEARKRSATAAASPIDQQKETGPAEVSAQMSNFSSPKVVAN